MSAFDIIRIALMHFVSFFIIHMEDNTFALLQNEDETQDWQHCAAVDMRLLFL